MKPKDNGNGIGIVFEGQGSQKPEMFKELVHSQNHNLRRAAEEILEILKGFGSDGSDVVDIYYNSDIDPVKVNSTRNVQPGLAARSAIFHRTLEYELGYDIVPDAASGYSFGVIPSLYALGVLSLGDMLNIAMMRGEAMSSIKPGQFYVTTIRTKEPVRPWKVNRGPLRRTGFNVCLYLEPDLIVISGPIETKDRMEQRLEKSGIVKEKYRLDSRKFNAPFHHKKEMPPYAMVFDQDIDHTDKRRKKETGESMFKDPNGLFVTNGGKILTDGEDIKEYICFDHIVKLCNFDKTVKVMVRHSSNILGIGPVRLKPYAERGYMRDYRNANAENLEEVARWYDGIMDRRERELMPEPVPKLIPSYSSV